GGYRLRAGSAMPPLLLDDEEAIAIAVGLRTAAGASVAGIEEAAVRALVKLEQVLPVRVRHRVAALGSATLTLPVGGPAIDPGYLTVIATACRDCERLRFAYTRRDGTGSRPAGERSSRSMRKAASTGPARKTSGGWRCGSRCSESTSRCTSRRSWPSTSARWPRGSSVPPAEPRLAVARAQNRPSCEAGSGS